MSKAEAQCPECKTWHPVKRVADSDGDSGWWWVDPSPLGVPGIGIGCPSCGSPICVESECEFRHAVYSCASPREFVRWDAVDHQSLEVGS